jgi:hypothetical protein
MMMEEGEGEARKLIFHRPKRTILNLKRPRNVRELMKRSLTVLARKLEHSLPFPELRFASLLPFGVAHKFNSIYRIARASDTIEPLP